MRRRSPISLRRLELLKTLPDTPERASQELTLHLALGPALMATKGFAAPEVEQHYTRARELCEQLGDTPQLFPVLFGLLAVSHDPRRIAHGAGAGGGAACNSQSRRNEAGLLLEAHLAARVHLACGEGSLSVPGRR